MFDTQLKNVRQVYLEEACNFVKSQTIVLQKYLTKEHHKLVERFIEFKLRT